MALRYGVGGGLVGGEMDLAAEMREQDSEARQCSQGHDGAVELREGYSSDGNEKGLKEPPLRYR
ncbi:hypothetical protein E2C01_072623 [Portunus trituberculatus]|uniref:Uncharacterized protein n=1 Tax=Portunus trituberculatus TaxID=210409 RepID=A0A5B7I318_PORTR|nr:hypothetical protein [Portunus trituberculatus]